MNRVVPTDPAGRAGHVSRFVESGLEFADANRDRSLIIRYEDLTESPEAVLERAFGFIGETFEPSILNALASATQGGLEDPKIGAQSQVHADSVARWRRDLGEEAAAAARPAVAALMERFGYEG